MMIGDITFQVIVFVLIGLFVISFTLLSGDYL
ncbi:hypothetical protein J2S13_003243 [Oikeobacillus pervagus]|uniref:Uncharacterized protein n=1 Tax=Oikeobacillus pervagus TaxID=1325931 RepID=A0AAJ1T6F3_9BACI|nr:hypothetical protein [Oikeobacillus pervagus]